MIWGILAICVLVLTGCAVANRFYVPPPFEQASVSEATTAPEPVPATLELTSWNIGYAGMGRESDFIMDKGQQKRPLSADLVDKNLTGITDALGRMNPDIFLFQEAAKPSWSTYGRDVLAALRAHLPGYAVVFRADVDTKYVPPPLKVEIGNAIFSRVGIGSAEWRALPLEPNFSLGLFRKNYRMHIARLAGDTPWVIINIHLSTFDDESVDVRRKQVGELLGFAQEEYRKGHHVVIGGDWNLRLAENEFPHRTEDRFRFWIRDFPRDLVPPGWSWAVDETRPTVRTAHQPYVPGDNYVLTIDGFLVSPNVRVLSVETRDLGFEFSDHNPVTARLAAR